MSSAMKECDDVKVHDLDFERKKSARNRRKMRNIGRTLKIVVFITCLVGFGYQVVEFCTHFLTYPTVTNIEVESIDSFILPALTFCNINPVQRSKYCDKYPSRCGMPKDMNLFCSDYPFYCKENTSNFRIPKRKYQADLLKLENRLTEEDVIELGQNPSDFDVTNRDDDVNSSLSSKFTRVYFTNVNKDFYLCYTTNARYTNTEDPLPKTFEEGYPTNFGFFLLNVQPEESFRQKEKHGLRFLIHSPYFTMNPYIKGFPMKPGTAYKIHILLQEENLLPSPYKTDCIDYEDLWIKSGKTTAPRSQQMCKNNCQRDYNKECYGCEKDLTFYLESDKVCNLHDNLTCKEIKSEVELEKNLKACIKLCKKDCRKLKYPYTVEEIPETTLEEENIILVAISVDDPEVMILSHKPQYQKVELFSYIGGFMGCWLGLSIWAFVGYIAQTIQPVKEGISTIRRHLSSKRLETI